MSSKEYAKKINIYSKRERKENTYDDVCAILFFPIVYTYRYTRFFPFFFFFTDVFTGNTRNNDTF